MADATAFKKLTQREHVLARPGMYIGSIEPEVIAAWVVSDAVVPTDDAVSVEDTLDKMIDDTIDEEIRVDNDDGENIAGTSGGGGGKRKPGGTDNRTNNHKKNKASSRSGPVIVRRDDLVYVPGLFKIYDEIIVNAIDQATRLKRSHASDPEVCLMKKIMVLIDRDNGAIEVHNDGDGIPVEMHPDHGCYVPELIFGHLLTSANYNDEEEAASAEGGRTIGGQNGIGAKACNIYCRWFEVETVDRVRKKYYKQRFEDNMTRTLPPVVKASRNKPYVTVRFLPDYARFGMEQGLSDDMYALMARRVYDATAVTDSDVSVHLDGCRIEAKSFERYVDLYLGGRGEAARAYERINDGWEVAVATSDGTGMQQVSFVNGVATLRGGKHVDHIVQQICKRLGDTIQTRCKNVTVRPQYIRDGIFVFVRATVPNPTFDSQSKETLTTPASKFCGGSNNKIELSDKFIDKLYKLDGLVDRVSGLSDAAAERGLKKTDGTKRSTVYGIKKLDDAEWAGTAKSRQCTLILTEGDSAKAMAVAGLAVVGRQKYGVFPLRGKLMNVCDVSADKIAANEEISNLKKILGLQSGRTYTSTAELRYGRIMAMTDQDTDGTHIRGLLFNLFLRQWPSLLKLDGFMTAMLTPIVKAVHGRTKEEVAFYNLGDFEAWRSSNGGIGWRVKYYKGLGTSTNAEAREYFKKMRIVAYRWEDATSADALGLSFDKKRADDRKSWLQTYRAEQTLDYGKDDVSYREFVDLDLKHFSNYDVQRSIPSAIDGLKVSQRKAVFGCFKRNLKEEVKVAQLAAYVAEHSAFHHGDVSMQGTIIGLAQDFVGSNNVNLLQPVGQFGTRLAGGSDHASPRYINTHLTPAARAMFVAADEPVLKRAKDDDGNPVEPKHYVPVLPMVLINGAAGIGTGYSTNVPCFNPHDVAAALRVLIAADDPDAAELPRLTPWFRGFTGTIEPDGDKGRLRSRGVLRRTGNVELAVEELPLGMWTEDFKDALEAFIEKHAEAKSYENRSTDVTVCFALTFATKDALEGWLALDASRSGLTRLETELKMTGNRAMLSTSNMHLFNEDGQIRKYDTVDAVLRAFFKVRLAMYEARKAAVLEAMCHDALVLDQKVTFLGLVIRGELKLHQRDSGSELDEELDAHGLARVEGSFKYLLGMAMSSMTRDRKAALESELVAKRAEIAELEGHTVRQLWEADIKVVIDALGY